MVDIAIVGAGPAGLSAAVNALARNKTVALIGREAETSAIYRAPKVENHLGTPGLSGAEMMAAFTRHALAMGVTLTRGRVIQIVEIDGGYALNVDNEMREAKAVILAVGAQKGGKLPGEERYVGLGVSYCATCDAMLYRGKDVFIYGDSAEADEDARLLGEVCKSVTYLPKHTPLMGSSANVRVISGKLEAVVGDDYVTGVTVAGETIPCHGAFFIKANQPPDSLLPGLALDGAAIAVNRLMETNLPGVYACGDCTGWPLQLSKAIGEGLVAGQAAARFVS